MDQVEGVRKIKARHELTDAQVLAICLELEHGYHPREIAIRHDVLALTVRAILESGGCRALYLEAS